MMWLVLVMILHTTRATPTVVCRAGTDCHIPCTFRHGHDLVVHWICANDQRVYLSYYHAMTQRATPGASLMVSHGNATLALANATSLLSCQRLKCYTSTINGNKEQFIRLVVWNPVDLAFGITPSGDAWCNTSSPGAHVHRDMLFCNASSMYDWSAVRFDSVLPTATCAGGVQHDSGLCVARDLQGVAHVLGTVAHGTVSHGQLRGIVLATLVVRTVYVAIM
ncbi:hypothetical protein IJGMMPBP_00069 [Infectious spleen and kidney necrosis virus]|uniref:ORF069L n=3 Tax=Infectious spleen and kidney necrosis virus TaxID=180170 RepID=Q8QUP1_ISKNN|nr:ORF069L [Infectious spleen and kidney necrosis virus]QIQ54511.1 ORF067 [Angelfish iridovirus AFIV-16]QOE77207.1 hypothetical protein [Banggai cardinalfish iridovirus]AAL98793.1 ORF069L [Infectious spleen and kidney necrosis virus]QPO16316.1 hypothetical protein [Infectious spleen and kidney necrosis virus]QPO16436.1 hypothetical protein [Infectious spleen and kidney necrosis virus]